MMHADGASSPTKRPNGPGVALYDAPVYPHTSTFRSDNLELSIRSPKVRYVEDYRYAGSPIPVFHGKDSVGGTVTAIIPSVFSAYELVISIEGAFFWIGPQKEESQSLPVASTIPKRIKHVFLSSAVTIPLVVAPIASPKRHVALHSTLRKTILRSALNRTKRQEKTGQESTHVPAIERTSNSFTFQLPTPGSYDIPGAISVSRLKPGGLRARWYAEGIQIAYKVTAQLRSTSSEQNDKVYGHLEAPVLIESEIDRSSLHVPSGPWTRFALAPRKTLPFRCLLHLPELASFSRSDIIPFYISFKTSPADAPLARKIMKEANVRITLVRVLVLDSALAFPAPIPRTRPAEERPSPHVPEPEVHGSILKRVATNAPNLFVWPKRRRARPNAYPAPKVPEVSSESEEKRPTRMATDKPLPQLPQESVKVYEDVICMVSSEGFKKCIAQRSTASSPPRWTNTRDHHGAITIPDGFFKGELKLRNEICNTIDWPGLSLTYFVEATVMFAGDVNTSRHAVRIVEPYQDTNSTP